MQRSVQVVFLIKSERSKYTLVGVYIRHLISLNVQTHTDRCIGRQVFNVYLKLWSSSIAIYTIIYNCRMQTLNDRVRAAGLLC